MSDENQITFKDKVINDIQVKLGKPVIAVELDDSHYELAYNNSNAFYSLLKENSNLEVTKEYKATWIFNYALAEAKEMLSRIRGKFKTIDDSILPQNIGLDAKTLMEESINEKQLLIKLIENKQ